jgi:hypothetical protein
MVSRGLNYISKSTINRALKFVFGTWIIAMLNYGKKDKTIVRNID